MCQRDSFILCPESTGIPVAWSLSYHHEEILKWIPGMRWGIYPNENRAFRGDGYIQIECRGGDVTKWDWDNTPMIKKYKAELVDSKFFTENGKDFYGLDFGKCQVVSEPQIPSWLEDNLQKYTRTVERILEAINPLRDRQSALYGHLICFMGDKPSLKYKSLPRLLRFLRNESAEVKEFIAIVNGYKNVPGFVCDADDINWIDGFRKIPYEYQYCDR